MIAKTYLAIVITSALLLLYWTNGVVSDAVVGQLIRDLSPILGEDADLK